MKITNSILIASLLGTLSFITTAQAEVAIIANPGTGASELDAKTAKKLFLGKIKSIPGIDAVTLVGQADSSPTKAEFTQKATRKGLDKYRAYWAKMIFSGKATPPKEMENDAEVKAYIASHKDAVGYVDASMVDDSVKILFRLP